MWDICITLGMTMKLGKLGSSTYSYKNSRFLKPGQLIIATGTTPSLFQAGDGMHTTGSHC